MRTSLRLVAAGVIGLLAGSVFLAESALHVPDHSRVALTKAQGFARAAGASVEAVQVRAADGALLEGWLFTPARPNGGGVIVLHGVGDTRMGALGHVDYLLEAGYTVLTPDSRGHGARPSPSGGGSRP